MKRTMLALVLLCSVSRAHAASLDLEPQYPAHSWTYNVDFKDPAAIAPEFGREVVEGQWKGGVSWKPASFYRVDDAQGTATRWFTAGVCLMTNAEKLNATFGTAVGLDVLRWTSQAAIAGPLKSGMKLWKPLGLTSITTSIDLWGGLTPIHTGDVKHWYSGGFGFTLQGKFGQSASEVANAILKAGI